MIDGSKKRNRQLAFELQNSHVCEKRSKRPVHTNQIKNMPFQKCPYSCGHGLRILYAAYFYRVINFSLYLSFTVHSVHFIERKAQGFMSVLSIRIIFNSIYQFIS